MIPICSGLIPPFISFVTTFSTLAASVLRGERGGEEKVKKRERGEWGWREYVTRGREKGDRGVRR